MTRQRLPSELRPVELQREYTAMTPGSVLIKMGSTWVLSVATIEHAVPRWLRGEDRGWVTAEYSMLPGSGHERIRRQAYTGGRAKEISRLIGRSLRSVVDLKVLGELMVRVDCDVLQADGGTRTAAITGAWVALHDALSRSLEQGDLETMPIIDHVAAVSVGIVDGAALLDLDYEDDVRADVDMNVVMTGRGLLVEVQGTAEGAPFDRQDLETLLDMAGSGIDELVGHQKAAVATDS